MKNKNLFKGALVILTSLALVLSTSTTAWAASPVSGQTGGISVEGGCSVSGQRCYAYTRTLNGEPSVYLTVSATATCRNRINNRTYYETLPLQEARSGVSTSATIDSQYEILLLTAFHTAKRDFYESWTESSSAP